CWTCARVIRLHSAERSLRNNAILLLILLAMQITLGALTIWSGRAVLATTAHVTIGAAVLGASLALTIRVYELKARTKSARIPGIASIPRSLQRQVSA
ncbi:MAG TPA: hypothetical protein VJ728_13440, partial [Candidatus Binataceae bacterium]|nr:hypothetical protein [Candidatus Binataceae bacterium]